jgi:hypothetical protein
LTLLQPGITQNKMVTNAGGKQPGTLFSSNGAGFQSNSYTLDGANLISLYAVSAASGTGNTLGVDGIREYKVVTNNSSAEYGLTMGAQTVLVSKSGTNSFHGDGFEFLRNSVFDADNYFDSPATAGTHADGSQRRIPEFRRNNFGGALGGPIQKDKTFFHAAYEALRENIGQSISSPTIPSNCYTLVANPCNGGKNVTNPGTIKILQVWQVNSAPNTTCNFSANALCFAGYVSPEPITENWGQGRLDHTFSSSDTFFGRYTFDDSFYSYGLSYNPFRQIESTRSQFTTLSENHVFSSSLLNTVRFSYSRTAAHIDSPDNFAPYNFNLLAGQVIPGLGSIVITNLTPSTQGAGYGPTSSLPTWATQNIFTWSDDLFWVKGKHSLKFGTLMNYYQMDLYNQNPAKGQFSFSNLANFMSGTLNSIKSDIPPVPADAFRHYRFNTYGVYAQDDYKVNARLTVNLGLRYEFATVASDRDGLNSLSNPTCVYPCTSAQLTGPLYKNPYLHNFGPRIGFAWDVFGNGKTSLRAGGALMYDVATLGEELNGLVNKGRPFGANLTINPSPAANSFALVNQLNGAKSDPESNTQSGIAYNLKAPKMYQWNMTVEQQLPWTMALQISYVGARGIHLLEDSDVNPWPFTIQNGQPFWPAYVANNTNPTTGACLTGFTCRVFNPSFGAMGTNQGIGDSYYNSLEVSVTKRLAHGFQFQSAYTYAKLIDTGDGAAPSQGTSTSDVPVSILAPTIDRSLGSFDVRNNYRFNMVYHLPTLSESNSFVNGLVNGWWSAVIFGAQNGYPFTPSINANRSRSMSGAKNPTDLDRPDWLPGRNAYNATHGVSSGCTGYAAGTPLGTPSLYFDPCAFTLEPIGYEGNVGRNSLIGPGYLGLDFSLVKDTKVKWLGEAGNIQFRAEVFNIINHPNFAQPSREVFDGATTVGTSCPISGCPAGTQAPQPGIGLITSTASGTASTAASGNSRQIQFGLKLAF